MNNISVTPKGGTIASELSGNQVNLTAPSVVKLHLNQSDIKSFTRNGNDLVVTTKSGEVVVIHGFYSPNGDSDLVLQDDRGAMWWVEDPGTEGFQYVSIDSTEGLLAENTTNDGTIAAFGIGGAALAGIGALFAGSGGGGGNASPGDNGGNPTNPTDPDTTPPAVVSDVVVTDAVGPYQGTISAGGITDDNTPTLSGTAEAGAIIRIYDGNTLIGSVTAGADGSWSFTTPTLTDGQHSLSVTATDAAGNTSAASNPVGFTVDTVAPDAVAGLTVVNNSGSTAQPITNGGATNDTTPQLSGTAEAGSIITIRDGNTVLGSVTVGSNGAWSFTSPALSQGSHTLSITATDAAGNSSTPTTITFTVDTQAPAAATELSLSDNSGNNSGNVPNGSSTDDNTPTLSGRGEAGAVVSVYDGQTLLGTAVVGANGSWSFTTPTLSNGSHSLTVTLTDAAGNVSPASPAYEVNVQAGIPPATTSFEITDDTGSTLVQLSNGASTHDNTPTLSGLATAGALITLYNGTTVLGSVVAGSDGQWTFTPGTLADGSYALHASVTDTGGNVTQTPTISITIDTVAPAAAGGIQLSDNDGSTLQPIASGGATNTTTPVLSGTAEPGSTVTVRDGSTVLGTATVGSNGTWSFTSPTLTEGNHSLTTTVTDAAGNVGPGSSPITFTVDTQAPTVASNVVISDNVGSTTGPITAGGTTDDNTPTLTGNGEANAIVKIYDGTTLIGSVTVGTNGSWSFTTPTLSNGSHSLSVTLTDAAGNVSPASPDVEFTVNAGVPPTTSTLEITDDSGSTLKVLPEGSSTQDTTPTLSGLAAANAVVELYNGTTLLGSTVAGADGQWSFTPAALADGTYAFHAVATDTSGNVTDSGTINITVDTVVPDAASGVALTNDAGSITQPVTSGNAINDATPVLSGSAEAGSTVTILDGTTVLGTVTVGSDGNWSFTTPTLAEGNHSLTTTVTDAAGNVSPATAPIVFSVDTVAPAATSGLVVTDNVGSSTGPLTSGTITDDSTPTLSGTAEAGAVVRVYDGTTLLGSATVGSNGSWSFTPDAALTNGQHSLTTTVTDAAGNVSPSSPVFTLNVDAGVPATNSLLIVSDDSGSTLVELPNNSSTNDTTPILSGQASEGDLITLYNGTTIIGSVVAGTDGQWNFTPAALADGNYAFHATATNPTTGVETDTPTINITIDTVVPTAPADVALTNDAGDPIPAGSSTNDNTPTLSGTGEAGGTVTVSDGTTVLGTTTVGNDGNWSYTTPPLSDGNHSLTSTVTDPAGNTGPASPPVTVTVDTQPPAAAGNVQFSNDDGTPIAAGGTTNDTTPTLSGTAEPGSTVTVSDGTTELGTATTGSDGNWSFTPTEPLSEGQHNLSTTVTDPAGNVGPASSVVIVIVDTTAPAVASDLQLSNDGSGTLVPIADGGTTNDLTPVLSGRAEPGSIVTILDGTSVLGSVAVGNDGNWSFTSPALDPGAHSLTTTVTDAAGNTGAASTPLTFTLDVTTPPAPGGVQLSNDTSGTPVPINSGAATNDATPVLSGTAAEGSTITVSDGGTVLGTVTVGSGGEWSFTTPALNEGNHSLTATVTSPAGNTSAPSTPIVVTVDITPPAAATGLQLSNNDGATPLPIAAGGTTNDTTPALSGTAEAGSIVTVRDGTDIIGSATVGSDGSWSVTPSQPLAAGEHTLTATVTDPAGNVGPTSTPITVNIDTTQPPAAGDVALNNDNGGTPVPITSGGATNDTTPVISGTAAAGSTVTVLDGTTVLGTVTVGSGGTWSFTTPALSEGAHSLTTTVTSPAGNVSDPSTAIAFTVDTQPPATSTGLQLSNDGGTTIAAGGITNDNTPILRGTAEAGSTVTVRDGTTVLGTATAGTDGSWSFTPATALGEGAHSLTTTVTDPAGNSSGASTPIAFTVDTTPPAAATDLQLSNDSSGTAVPIDTGGRTNDTTPVLSGSAEAGSVVTVSDNGAVLGSTTVGTDGKWSFTPTTPLDAGGHSLTTTVTDTAGNVGPASSAVTVTIDTEAPPAATDVELNNDQGNTPAPIASGGATNDTTPVLSGNADPDSIVVVRDGTTVLGTVIVGNDGAWSFTTPALSQGEHSLTATVTDAAGNSSAPSTAITFTVDTEAPSAATGLQLSNDSGGTAVPIAVGGSTNDTTPVLSGSAEAGSTVTISDGSNVLGSVVVGSSGNWSFTSTVLGEGPHSLTTTVTDPAGNVSAPSAALNFSIDTTPPAAPDGLELSNNNGSTPVAIDGNSTTNDATPLLSGTAEAGSTVTVRDGTQVLGSAIVGSNGQWSFTTPTLGEGGHSLTATVTDPAGNVGPASSAIAFTVDTVAPVAATGLELNNNNGGTPVPIANNGTTNDSTPLLSGTAEANSIVIVSDGTTVLGSAIANAQGDWSFSPTLTDGTHNLSVTVRDAAGNTSPASSAITVTVDTVAPPAATGLTLTNDIGTPVTIPNGGLTNDNTPVLSGSGQAGSIITIADQNGVLGSTTVGAGGTWSFTPQTALADGTHTFSVTASDAAGNVSAPATIGVVIDATPPAVAGNIVASNDEGTSPVAITNGGATNDNTPFLTGTAEAGSTIIIRDGTEILGSASVGSNGQWSFSSPQLDDGEHSLTTTVVDAAGNAGPASTAIEFTVDTTVPTPATLVVSNDNSGAPVLVPNGASTSDNTPLLSGAAEAGSLVTIYDGNVVIGSTTALGDGSWSFSSPVLTDGSHTLTATVTDEVGNVSAPSASFTVVVDVTPPQPADDLLLQNNNGGTLITIADGGITNDSTPAISGTAEANAVVRVYDGTTLVGSAIAGSNGAWSITTTALSNATHTLNVSVTDAAGNVSSNASVSLTVDTSTPAQVLSFAVYNDANTTPVQVANEGDTNDNTPVISGTGVAGTTINVYEGPTLLGTTTVGDNGTWSFQTTTLSDGQHSFTVSVTNAAGTTGPEATPITVYIDTSVPDPITLDDLTVNDNVGGSTGPLTNGVTTDDNTPTFSGTAEAGSRISIYDGTTLLGTVNAVGGNWSYTPGTGLSNGGHSFTFTVTDAAGNVSAVSSPAFTLNIAADLPPATSTLVITDDNGTTPVELSNGANSNDSTPVLTGAAEEGDVITIHDGATVLGSVTVGNTGQWSFTPTLADGAHGIYITTVNSVGNPGATSPTVNFTIDTGVPLAATNLSAANNNDGITVPIADNGITNDSTPRLAGLAEANGIVTVYDGNTVIGSTVANASGEWTFTAPTLSQGGHALSVTVTDAAGNVGPRSDVVNLTVDTLAPNASTLVVNNDETGAVVPNGGATNDNTPTLSGTAEVGSVITIYDGTTLLGSVAAGAGGDWNFTTAVLGDGSHALSVRVTDAAGNTSVASSTATVIVDTAAPAAVSGLAAANNNGSSPVAIAAGGTTNDSTPALSGTAEAGSIVKIFDGANQIGSVTAGSNGAWSFTSPTLADGLHTLTVTATDAAGNVSPDASISLTVITAAPTPVTNLLVSDNVGATTGNLSNGASTDDNTPTLSGTATAGNVVIISEGSTVLGSAVAGSNGAWSFTTAALSDGSHPLSVTVRDAAGNTSTATNFTVNVDTVAPANATLLVTNDTNGTTVPNGGSTNDSTPTLSGTAEAGSRVSVYDGTTLLGTATAGSGGAWSFTTDVLTQGAHALSVTVTDAAGNVSGSTAATVNIDTVAPVAITGLAAANNNGSTPVAINAGGSTNDNTPALSGSAEAGSLVIIRDGTAIIGSVTAGSNGSWSFTTPTLADGAHTLNVTATDAAGNVSPNAAFALTIDTVAPSPVTNLVINDNVGTIQGPLANGAVTDDATPTLSGTAEANAIVTIYDGSTVLGSVTAGAGGAWTFTTATLSNGVHPLSVTVKDAAGNTSAATTPVSITVDTVAPTASTLVITNDVTNTTVPSGGATNDTTPTLSGVAEAGSRVTIYDGAAPLGTAIAGSDGSWTFTTGVLTTGPHPLSVTVTDAAGNVSGTTSASVIIDTTPPAAVTNLVAANNNGSTAVTIPNNGVTNDSTPLLTGSGEIGAKISVYDGTTLLGTTTVGSNGTWSFVSTALSNGTHTLNVTATDAAGNVSPTTSTTLSIDTVAPNPVTNLVITDDVGTIQGPLANGASTDDATPTLSGTAEANAIVTVYDGTTVLGSVTAGSTGAWTFTTATLSNGTHPLSVTVTDAAGNTSAASATVSITVDTVAPAASTLVITNDVTGTVVPSGGATNDTTPTLSGSAEVGSRVSIFDGGTLLGTVTVGSGGTWSFTTATLAQGTHPLSVTVTDAAGNVSGTTAASVTIDTVAPAAVTSLVAANNNGSTAIAIPNNGATNDSTPLLTGNGEVGARISVYDGTTLLGTTTVGSNGSWSFISTPLSNGTHTLNVTATDAAGNVSPNASTTLRVDTVAPAASSLTITDDAGSTPVTLVNGAYTRDTTPVLNGTAEVGAIVTIYDGTTALGSVTVGAGGTWTYTTTALANGAHPLSVTVTDAAGNVSTGNTAVTVNVDTVPPAAVSGLAINDAGTTVTGSGEVGAIVTVRDAGGNALGTATVGTGGTWSVSLSTAQTTGASLSVIQTDRAGNVSTSSPLTGAIRIVAANDVNEVDYTTQTGTLNNGTTSVSHTALLTVGLGNVLQASVLTNGNAYLFNVGPDDTRTVTLNGSISSVGLLTNYSLNLYEQQSNGTWLLINSTTNYLGAVLSLGTLKGANVTYNNLGTGNYAVIVASTVNVSLLPTSTISTVSDITTLAVTVAATVTGNLLTNDTSSLAGTIPNGTAVTAVSGNVVAATGNTVINTTYGTLTIDSHGNYTYALKAGLNIDTLPAADTFTYSVRDASGALTSASLTVNLHNGASATSLLAANSLFADTTSGDHDASGSIYGSSTASHTGTLSITNEHGDITTVHSVGTTAIAGDFGVLSIAANGSYTYALNAGVDGQSLTHKEVFSYTLAANDGTITSQSFTIELHPTITGTAGADTLTGGAYDDTITSGAGADTLVYHLLASADATGGNGHDTWTDFNVAQGDKIDVSNLLIGWNDSTSNINDFVKVDHTSDGNTVLSIDRDGTGTGYSATQLITLEGVNVSLEELLQQPHQNHTV